MWHRPFFGTHTPIRSTVLVLPLRSIVMVDGSMTLLTRASKHWPPLSAPIHAVVCVGIVVVWLPVLTMRANGMKRTAELTTASALFIHGTPSDGLGYHRPANTDGKRGCYDQRYPRDTDSPPRPLYKVHNKFYLARSFPAPSPMMSVFLIRLEYPRRNRSETA